MKNGTIADGKARRIMQQPIIKIISGLFILFLVPVVIKAAILRPLFSLINLQDFSRIIQAIISSAVILITYCLFLKWLTKER